MKKILTVILCALLIATFATACAPKEDGVSKIKEEGKLVMLTNAEFPPYEYLGANNEVVGIDVNICQAIANEIGVELEAVHMDFDGLISALKSGKGDLIAAGMTVDEERMQNVDFSVTYADATQIIIVNKENPKVTGENDLAGKTIGVQTGTTGDLYCTDSIEGADVRRFKSGLEAAMDLKNGRLDAVVLDELPAQSIVENNTDLALLDMESTDEQYAIAVNKGDEALLEVVNNVIEKLIADGKIAEFTATHVEASKGI
ncbi:basic amino acid ABC transporter substrate-binding protein [Christensenellaceae bacterium OttesenSCG-928-K19]|nr:basic amino acid ABC transporter substrate-binding protein [Christensenellaceae bacterium OttesenSCG-928-K19]